MRRPNGSGSVYKLSGKRHKPWCAKVVTGWSETGQPKYKYVGYYRTKTEAQEALAVYKATPAMAAHITFSKAYERFIAECDKSPGTIAFYKSAYNRMSAIFHTDLDKLSLDQMQELCDQPPVTYARAMAVKKVLSSVLTWGYAHDYCLASRKELLEYLKLPERPTKTKAEAWTDEEVLEAFDRQWTGAIVLLFTGLRFGELLALTADQIHLDEQYIDVQKSKTKAGIRQVPIPDGLLPYVRAYIKSGAIGKGRQWWGNHLWPDEIRHTHHDCRHTYITMLTAAGVDSRMIKALVGHAGDVTTDVYTHLSMRRKIDTVNQAFERYFPVARSDGKTERLLA